MQEDKPPAAESVETASDPPAADPPAAPVPKDSVGAVEKTPKTTGDTNKGPMATGFRVATPQQKVLPKESPAVAPPSAPSEEGTVPAKALPHQPGQVRVDDNHVQLVSCFTSLGFFSVFNYIPYSHIFFNHILYSHIVQSRKSCMDICGILLIS